MSQVRARLRDQLDERPLVLDGATGTELERLGAATTLPLWSATALWECPRLLEDVDIDAGFPDAANQKEGL